MYYFIVGFLLRLIVVDIAAMTAPAQIAAIAVLLWVTKEGKKGFDLLVVVSKYPSDSRNVVNFGMQFTITPFRSVSWLVMGNVVP